MPYRKLTSEESLTDHDLLIRIDERVEALQKEAIFYRGEVESLKKRVYSICGGLAIFQFGGPMISKLVGFLFPPHSSNH